MPEILKNISRVNLRMRWGLVVFGEVIYAPGGICGPRTQRDYQLVILHRGSLDLHLDGQRIAFAAPCGILLSPSHREHFIFSPDCETHHSWCSIDARAVPQKLRRLLRSCSKPWPVDRNVEALMELGKAIFHEGHPDSFLENTFHLNLGLALLTGFALRVRARTSSVTTRGDQVLARAEQFILKHYEKKLTLMDMAGAAGVSRQHLLKLFRNRHHASPTQFLFERRLSVAADHLMHTGLSVKEVADSCGFSNAFHFSRKFKMLYGRSPRLWRAQQWGEA